MQIFIQSKFAAVLPLQQTDHKVFEEQMVLLVVNDMKSFEFILMIRGFINL